MTIPSSKIDLSYKPKGYFWPLGLKTHVVSSIKGAERKALVQKLFAEGRQNEIESTFIQSALPDELRKAQGAIHPWLMGGEYLPDHGPKEVEIARITIASTTRDVTSVYARRGKDRIRYRVVDEYDGDTLGGKTYRTSKLPLTLQELAAFFLQAWDLFEVLAMNFEDSNYPQDEILDFFEGTSEFYPNFGPLISQRVEEWLNEISIDIDENSAESDEKN